MRQKQIIIGIAAVVILTVVAVLLLPEAESKSDREWELTILIEANSDEYQKTAPILKKARESCNLVPDLERHLEKLNSLNIDYRKELKKLRGEVLW